LIKHIKDTQYERGCAPRSGHRGIACPLPLRGAHPDLEQRSKEELVKLAHHWYY